VNKEYTSPLDFLPEAMVDEMLARQKEVVESLATQISQIANIKMDIRRKLEELNQLKNVNELIQRRGYPTTVGVDGSYGIIRHLSLDTVGLAAVAVEGLVPPRETRLWQKPQHIVRILPVKHHADTQRLCRAIMFSYELELATKAPHTVVFMDGSLTSQLIGMGQGLSAIQTAPVSVGESVPEELCKEVSVRLEITLRNYLTVLTSPRTDRLYVGVPKYSSKSEVIKLLQRNGFKHQILETSNDKGLLSVSLKAGDVVGPVGLQQPESPWHLSGLPKGLENLRDEITGALAKLRVLYFKPSSGHPALRIEVGEDVVRNKYKLSTLFDSLQAQAGIHGILEPYPLYVADVFVKHAYSALMELKEAALTDVDKIAGSEFPDVFLSLQDYRTEGGYD